MSDVILPAVANSSTSILDEITKALGVERNVLASPEEIGHAWRELPRMISKIPLAHRSQQHVRMCVAVAAGLLDRKSVV